MSTTSMAQHTDEVMSLIAGIRGRKRFGNEDFMWTENLCAKEIETLIQSGIDSYKMGMCLWSDSTLFKGIRYSTACGAEYLFDSSMIFCPHCGKKIIR